MRGWYFVFCFLIDWMIALERIDTGTLRINEFVLFYGNQSDRKFRRTENQEPSS